MTEFSEVIEHLSQKVFRRGIHYDLHHMKKAVHELGYPNESLPKSIHVAGTNGKGSTVGFLAEGLMACGFRVGTFTSPHLQSYTERISINGLSISEEDFVTYFDQVSQLKDFESYSEFEVITLLSFLYFNDRKPDYVIYETGLGGRFDATNLIQPIITIVTSIGLDHQDILGASIEAIAIEKAGIIKNHVPVITLFNQDPEASAVLTETATTHYSPYIEVSQLTSPSTFFDNYPAYQRQNFSLAAKALAYLVEPSQLNVAVNGMSHFKPWGRYTKMIQSDQIIMVDAAHNVPAIFALLEALQLEFPFKPLTFLVGIQKTKDYKGMINALSSVAKQLYVCEFIAGKSCAINDVFDHVHHHSKLMAYDASLIPKLPDSPIVVITGSIYFISQFQQSLTKTVQYENIS